MITAATSRRNGATSFGDGSSEAICVKLWIFSRNRLKLDYVRRLVNRFENFLLPIALSPKWRQHPRQFSLRQKSLGAHAGEAIDLGSRPTGTFRASDLKYEVQDFNRGLRELVLELARRR
jgi:hypothetical protein